MSKENVRQFFEALNSNPSFSKEILDLNLITPEDIIPHADKLGYTFTPEELNAIFLEAGTMGLSDEALSGVNAGAYPTSVNGQITDSIIQLNSMVLGDSPAVAMGNLFVATGQALSNAAHNATNNQQQSYVTMQASTTQGVSTLYGVDTAATGIATVNILGL